MSYIGKSPSVGSFIKLDALTASATASYTMQVGSVNFVPESVNHMLVSLNGVIQAPTTSFTISGSTLTFASALTSSDSIDFIMVYGNVLDIGTPSDSTISTAKIIDDAVTQAKLADESVNEARLQVSNSPTNGYFLSAQSGNTGGLTWAEAGGGKIGQVLSTHITSTSTSTTTNSFQDISGFSVAITPSATNSKVWIHVNIVLGNGTQTSNNYGRMQRAISGGATTSIARGDSVSGQSNETGSFYWRVDQGGQSDYNHSYHSFSYLDSPSTTSETTYKMQWGCNAGTLYLNRAGDLAGSGAYDHLGVASSITVMEVLA